MALVGSGEAAVDVATVVLAIRERLGALTGEPIPLRLWDGTEVGDGAAYRLVLEHPWSLRSLLLPPTDLNAGEAYVHGDIDIEGDLVAALRAIARVTAAPLTAGQRIAILAAVLRLPRPPRRSSDRRAALRGRRHSLERDRDAVRFHYDLGNRFFRLFLDSDLVYSCAYYPEEVRDDPERATELLDLAQRRKLELVCRKLQLATGERLLDVGCGWGSLAIHAARRYGAQVLGVTLSVQQAELARERVAQAGLNDRVEIRLADYREVEGTFDAVASVGMVEHVGSDQIRRYVSHLHRLTASGGRLLNHGITPGRRHRPRELSNDRRSFVGRYVFPDGALVPAWQVLAEVQRAGFEIADVQQLRPHYALTLRAWVARLEANHDRAVEVASERDYRIWRAYMAGSIVGFGSGDLGVVQVLALKGAAPPLGRGHLELP